MPKEIPRHVQNCSAMSTPLLSKAAVDQVGKLKKSLDCFFMKDNIVQFGSQQFS